MGWGHFVTALTLGAAMAGCAPHRPQQWARAQPVKATPMTIRLQQIPAAGELIPVAVYNFADQTGQFKPSDGTTQTLSRAVTQGATSILIKALQEAGNRRWFTVIERERLDNLLRERAVIREMRSSYLGERTINPQALPPLLFAGILIEGGIIGYDINTRSGGLGARFLGIGASTQYREDTVTVFLRAVSVKTGEVLTTVSVRKTIASIGLNSNAFRYVAFKDLLELEAGVAFNEPDALAIQQAIETAVYGLMVEGAANGLWCMAADDARSEKLLRDYFAGRDSIEASRVNLARLPDGSLQTGSCAAATRLAAQRLTVRAAARAVSPPPNTVRPVASGAPRQAGAALAKPGMASAAAFPSSSNATPHQPAGGAISKE